MDINGDLTSFKEDYDRIKEEITDIVSKNFFKKELKGA